MTDWRYFLCESPAPGADPTVPLKRITELLKSNGKSLDFAMNRGGEAGFNYPVFDRWTSELFRGVSRCIEARRGNSIEWSGPLANNNGQAVTNKAGSISVKAVGWLELLTRRELRTDVTYGATNPATSLPWTDAEIVFDLLNRVINYDTAHAPPIRPGSAFGTRYNRQKTWQKGTKIEQCFRELIELEAGINIEVDPATRLLNVYAWDFYDDHPNIVFGFNKAPNNIEKLSWQTDYFVTNRLSVYGDPASTAPVTYDDDASQDEYGLFEDTVNLTGVKETDILSAYAVAELAVKALPITHYTITPASFRKGQPQPFVDFKIGDRMRMSVDYGPIQEVNRHIRCYGFGLQLDGGEKMTSFKTTVS